MTIRLRGVLLAAGLALRLSASAQTCEVLHSFKAEGGSPIAPPLRASDGNLYGTTLQGGSYGRGSVYRLTRSESGDWSFATLYSFPGGSSGSFARLVQATDGWLYGTSVGGYDLDGGTVFRVSLSGQYEALAYFGTNAANHPRAPLVQGPDGALYGVASGGGAEYQGGVFRIVAPYSLSFIHDFTRQEGHADRAGLVVGDDGFLYGTTYGGDDGRALIYRMDTSGLLTEVHRLTPAEGAYPDASLVRGANGSLFGVAAYGGATNQGTIFRLEPDGTVIRLRSFSGWDGVWPLGLEPGADGKLYGTTRSGGAHGYGTAFRISVGGGFELLHSFSYTEAGGRGPASGLAAAGLGEFVGVTEMGGDADRVRPTVSTDPAASRERMTSRPTRGDGLWPALSGPRTGFCGGRRHEEAGTPARRCSRSIRSPTRSFSRMRSRRKRAEKSSTPSSRARMAPSTERAILGGAQDYGTFFRASQGGVEVLYDFIEEDGRGPWNLVQADDGNFYGGNSFWLIRLDAAGNRTRIRAMNLPMWSQVHALQASDGLLYLSEGSGGSPQHGSISRLELDGTDYTTLHVFSSIEGTSPGALIEASDGRLYGTTSEVVFRMDKAGNVESLADFGSLGGGSSGKLLESGGDLYGFSGAAFRLSFDGTGTVLYSFRGVLPGEPGGVNSPPVLGPEGLLYGTTYRGGQYDGGTIVRVDPSRQIQVSGISPATGPAAYYIPVTIAGAGFEPGAVAWLGSEPLWDPVVTSSTAVEATTTHLWPGTLNPVTVRNPDGTEGSLGNAYFADFNDVPAGDIFHDAIEKVIRDGVVARGCGAGDYCPGHPVVRGQLAVWLLKSLLGRRFVPRPATGDVFVDVDVDDAPSPWIEELATRGISAGCGSGEFCPSGVLTRAQSAVLILKTRLGAQYVPPPATGQVFEDVPADGFAAAWIEDLARRGISGGCSASPKLFCPDRSVTQAQAAALLVAAFGLP